jgi:magnesium-transporting ATPase (P-type)
MWMSTVLTSQTPVYAIIIYTGQETRAKLNSRSAPSKFGRFDIALNHAAKFLFLLMVIVTIWLTSAAGWHQPYKLVIQIFVRDLLLVSYICSISLRTVLDATKVYMANVYP